MPTTAISVRPANAPVGQQPLVFDREFTVGRRPGNGIVINNTTIVSGTHLRVRPTDQGWLIELVSQTNGMLVDGVDTRGPVLVTQPVRVQLANASGPVLVFVPQPAAAAAGPTPSPAGQTVASGQTAASAQTDAAGQAAASGQSAASAQTDAAGQAAASGQSAASAQTDAAGQTVAADRTTVMSSPSPSPAASAVTTTGAPSASSSAQTTGSQAPVDPRDPLAPVGQRRTIGGVRLTGPGTIGRYPDNALVIPDSAVSGRHARVERTPQGLVVIDNGSTNGIFVGGQRVPHVLITKPTVIGMGGHFVEVSPNGVLKLQERGGELIGRDLTFVVNDRRLRLLDRVSFQLPGNELLAVVGPSGAGKSTLLKALTGEQRAQEGQVLFNGMDVYEHYETMRNMIGVVPQNDVVHANLTVAQTLQYAAELRFAKDVSTAERDQRIAEVLDDLDLTEHVSKRVKQLSGGQRKRVSTAIELLTKPGLLFLDEPTSGLDPQLDRDVMDLLARLAHGTRGSDSGRTVMVVTHNENHIDRADKVLILATGGRPVYYGPPRDVLPYFTERLKEVFSSGRLVTHAPAGGFADPTEITGYADVYALVRNHTPELRAALEARVPSTRPTGGAKVRSSTADLDQNRRPQQSWLRQVSTLVRRHLRLVLADPSYLAFMLILPLVMGVLTKVMEGKWGFAVPDYTITPENPVPVYSTQALQLLVILITGAAFAGMAATIRELIGEREVFLREKAVGLRPGSYLLAKIVVLALIVTVQTLLMVGVALLLNDAPSDAVLLGSPGLELAVGCWLTAFACGLLGLAVSAFVTSSEQVMPVLVVTIMAQLVLAGGVIPVAGRAVFEQLAWVMPARWGYAVTSSTVDMNTIVPYRADDLWEHSLAQWGADACVLVVLGLVFAAITYMGLARHRRR
ncbi:MULTISPECIES: ATP-binding cassette domain-containing protein [Actinomyces]|uniref:ATP-binding cassette domain-containing protein n=1 Tax=Actinomyces TaxID=1654 RepID=UPI001FBC0209|nr:MULTISPECIES: ATP-binding cassette domain-containing protein [Actinomyces]